MTKTKLHRYLNQTTDKNAAPVHKELKDKDANVNQQIKQLRLMILESNDQILKDWRFTDEFLLRFIRGRKYNLESALEKLHNNVHSKRIMYPEFFAALYPSALKHVLEKKSMRILKHRDALGRQICIFRPEMFNPKEVNLDDLLRVQIMVVWEMMSFKETQLNGLIVIVDGSGFSARQVRVLTPHHVQKYVTLTLKCSPARIKGCHVLKLPHWMNFAMQMVKPLMPNKIHSRLFLHGKDLSVFYKFIPETILPDWLGGTLSENEACDIALENRILDKDDYYKDLIQ